MTLSRSEIQSLLEGFRNNTLSREEHDALFAALRREQHDGEIEAMLEAWLPADEADVVMTGVEGQDVPPVNGRVIKIFRRMAVAAAVLLLLAAGVALWNRRAPESQAASTVTDIAAGKKGAILTLEDGRQMVLDSMSSGIIAQQTGARLRFKQGQLAYDPTGKPTSETAFNTMSTPKGRQFQLTLPDGTRVWLNAASSIRYPTVFSGDHRRVVITGEAYLEVAKDATKPFQLWINGGPAINVLGTSFNVNAYADESGISTTLVDGSVQVVNGHTVKTLAPGQQSKTQGDSIRLVRHVNVDQVVAWKDGVLAFDKADLPTVMRQLARWYDVEVVYAGTVPAGEFSGKIDNSLSLASVLKGLAKTRIRFSIENEHKIIILP